MIQKVIIKRATMKGDGSEGNPKGLFYGRFKINGIEKTFTEDFEVMNTDDFEKAKERGKRMLFHKFERFGDNITITYDDDIEKQIDKQKKNFCTELLKMPEMRDIDSPPSHKCYWVVESGNEVSVRRASKIMKTVKILNILIGMSYKERINICFYFAPHLEPNKKNNSELFTILGDLKTDAKGIHNGLLIQDEARMDAVLNVYYKNTEESQFRTTIYKAIEWGIINLETKGYYINAEYIGGDKEAVVVYMKNNPQIFENFVLPKVAQKDIVIQGDDMEKVNAAKFELRHNVDRESKPLEDLRAEAKELGIKNTSNSWDKGKLIEKIKAKIAENIGSNAIAEIAD